MSNTTDILQTQTLNYVLKRIVFVNSANHGYSEIRLDNHLALFGANNAGKTASLSATKLMLYPETDFTHCDKKFQFKGKTGTYSKEDSYEFYFPSPQSFLVMETQNDTGTACVVLYRANNFRYYRVFLPLDYEAVRPLFWDKQNHCFAKDLSVEALLAFQKKHGGLHVNDDKQLAELMYGNFTGIDSRYGIVPLTESSHKAINAFRSIYQMAFDAGTGGTDALADAIATLIEMRRSRPEERMNADLASLEQNYQQLLQKNQELQRLQNHQDEYHALKSRFEALQNQHTTLAEHHAILLQALTHSQQSYAQKYKNLSDDITQAQGKYDRLNSQVKESEKTHNSLEGAIGELEKRIAQFQTNIQLAEKVLSEHKQTDADMLVKTLKQQQQALQEQQLALADSINSGKRLEQLTRQIHQNTQELEQQQTALLNTDALMLAQLPSHTADVLLSINADFGTLSTPLTDEQIDTLTTFANWFDNDGNRLAFNQVVMPNTPTRSFDIEQQKLSLQQRISHLEEQIEQDKRDQQALNTASKDTSGASRQQSLDEVQARLKNVERQINALERYHASKQDIEDERQQLKDKQAEIATLSDSIKALKTETNTAYQVLNGLLTQRQALEEQRDNFDHYGNQLKQVAGNIGSSHFSDEQIIQLAEKYHEQHGKPLTLDMKSVNALMGQANAYSTEYAKLIHQVDAFIIKVPNDSIETYANIQTLTELEKIISTYNNSFGSLDYQVQTQKNQIRQHNQIISNQLKEISDASQILNDYVASINSELNSHQISNLKQVRLKLHCHADFEHVRKLQQNHDITNDELMSDEFYRTLMLFMDKHANKRTKLIKMRDIISKINFEYVDVNGVLTDKSQSGGTTSTITASIIAILLQKIFMNGASFKMPIIIDEIGDLDDDNTSTIIDCIDGHGFSAFCATPTQRASVCQSVKRWIRVDYNVLDEPPKVNGCILNILPESVEHWGQQAEAEDGNGNKTDAENENGTVTHTDSATEITAEADSDD